MSPSSLREKVFSYVQSRYGSDIEYLWRRYPNYAVFRHRDNLKWYGLVMEISRNKLGLRGNEVVNILNVKTDSTQLADILRQREGCFAAYHMKDLFVWISWGNFILPIM